VDRLARERPVALLIDDAHAADAGTAALLRRVVTATADQPVLLVCTALPGPPGTGPVDALVAALGGGTPWLESLQIEPLDPPEATALAAGLLGGPIDAQLAGLVTERCAGRPLLIEALSRTLSEKAILESRAGLLGLRPGTELPLPAGVQA
jgi:predicted ATPase